MPVAGGPFQPTDESLATDQCPEWFRDATLGIWSHWRAVAAPGGFGGNWYARQMYVQGTRENLYHVATRGIMRAADYTAADIRFTRSKDGATLYAVALGAPADGRRVARSPARAAGAIRDVHLLGHSGPLAWTQGDHGPEATMPEQQPCRTATVLKIAGADLQSASKGRGMNLEIVTPTPGAATVTASP